MFVIILFDDAAVISPWQESNRLTALDFVDFTGFSVRFPKHKR